MFVNYYRNTKNDVPTFSFGDVFSYPEKYSVEIDITNPWTFEVFVDGYPVPLKEIAKGILFEEGITGFETEQSAIEYRNHIINAMKHYDNSECYYVSYYDKEMKSWYVIAVFSKHGDAVKYCLHHNDNVRIDYDIDYDYKGDRCLAVEELSKGRTKFQIEVGLLADFDIDRNDSKYVTVEELFNSIEGRK